MTKSKRGKGKKSTKKALEVIEAVKPGSPLHHVVRDMQIHIDEQVDTIGNLLNTIVPMAVRINNWIVSGEIKDIEKEELRLLCIDIIETFEAEETEITDISDVIEVKEGE